MTTTWFSVENNLIDRSDLSIYEKMCSVVLARYAGRAEFSNMLNIQVIAIRMGCSVEEAEKALNSLIAKKLVTLEDADRIEPELLSTEAIRASSRVIRSEQVQPMEKSPAKAFDALESFDEDGRGTDVEPEAKPKTPKKRAAKKKKPETEVEETAYPTAKPAEASASVKPTAKPAEAPARPLVPKQVREGVQELIDEIFSIVEENINDREARIILSFANNDVELVREKYKIAKRSQVSDKIEMLINELQRKDEPAVKPAAPRAETAKGQGVKPESAPQAAPAGGTAHGQTPKILQNAQIDLENINRMVAFKQSSYGKGKK